MKKLVLGTVLITSLSGYVAYAYSHSMLNQWDSGYQTATYRMQNTFGSDTKNQFSEAIIHLNSKLSKKFLYKSSSDTTATLPSSKDSMKTVTKYNYGSDGVLAEHLPYNNAYNKVIDSDIRVNTYYPYSNSGIDGTFDIKSVLTHELGHALRIGHSSNTSDSMYTTIEKASTKARTFTSNDSNAAKASTKRWFK